MPELPDITIYIEALEKRILGQTLERVRVVSPFLLRTATPPLGSATGKKVLRLRRVGKRICIGLEGDLWLVLHLMIAGRLHWRARGVKSDGLPGIASPHLSQGSTPGWSFGPMASALLPAVGRFKRHGPALEELLEPAIEHTDLQIVLLADLRHGHPFDEVPPQRRSSPPGSNTSAIF